MDLTPENSETIHVYNESPEWDKYERWFMAPAETLLRLYVCSYRVHDDRFEWAKDEVRRLHPSCMLVHI